MYELFSSALFFIYLTNYVYWLGDKKSWNKFTRIMSTVNALQCALMTIYNLYIYENKTLSLGHVYYFPNDISTNSLFYFCSYLYIDGIFYVLDSCFSMSFSYLTVLSLLHHFIGGYGIYLIASTRLGFFLGLYFAMTEFSTIFLNISWFYRTKTTFLLFYISFMVCRIWSAPFLLLNIQNNFFYLSSLPQHHIDMVYYGSYALIFLNSIWYILLTIRMTKQCLTRGK